ncbi:MAG: prepilin-type N-terminal cleavage/methylation domain-containing protein [Planctomycetota bacterium]
MRRVRRTTRGVSRGFTLIETALATVIIGVGVLAIIEAQQAFIVKNAWSSNAATGMFLASEIREMSRSFERHDPEIGGIYLEDPDDDSTLRGWGPQPFELDIEDIDDLDDLDGTVFGDATDLPDDFTLVRRYQGPINAFGEVLTQTLWDGTIETVEIDGEDVPVSMRGWTQIVEVDKVAPDNYTTGVADNARELDGAVVVREVDRYPLRVTVRVLFEQDADTTLEVARSTWVVTP